MTELEYHNGHYHRVQRDRRHDNDSRPRHGHPRAPPRRSNVFETTHDMWDKVLYGIGSAYDKVFGR